MSRPPSLSGFVLPALRLLLCSLLVVSLWSLYSPGALAQSPPYDQLMRQGYDALLSQDYTTALQQFTAARQLRPADPYVLTAIQNVELFLDRSTDASRRETPILPFLPLDLGVPSNRTSAGIRSRCSALEANVERKLTALAPRSTAGTTLAPHPALLFYIPETLAQQVEFALSDPQQQVIYRQTLELRQTPGIIRVEIPPEAPPLQVDQPYRWGLELVCDLEDPAKNATVIGSLWRVSLPGTSVAQQGSLEVQQQLTLQQVQGIWFDVVATLGQLRLADPEDPELLGAWQTLLAREDLETVAQEPLLSCCQP